MARPVFARRASGTKTAASKPAFSGRRRANNTLTRATTRQAGWPILKPVTLQRVTGFYFPDESFATIPSTASAPLCLDVLQSGEGVDLRAAAPMFSDMTASHVIQQLEKLPAEERKKVFAYVGTKMKRTGRIAGCKLGVAGRPRSRVAEAIDDIAPSPARVIETWDYMDAKS